jgi:small subunit ribosomal protein S5
MVRDKNTNRNQRDTQWQEKVVQVSRVTKVVKGGKKLSFRALVVIGNEKGQVGVGVGKATDVVNAVKKAIADGKRHLVTVPITKDFSIPHYANGRSGAAKVFISPSSIGSGVRAGGSMRTVLELAGIKNILSKQMGSSNLLNNALKSLKRKRLKNSIV